MPVGIDLSRGRDAGLLRELAARSEAVGPALARIATLIRQRQRRAFASGGFGAWAPLDPETIRGKGGSRVLVDSGELLASLTQRRARYSIERTSDDQLVFGTANPVAHLLRDGARGTPARNPLPPITDAEIAEWADELLAHISGDSS